MSFLIQNPARERDEFSYSKSSKRERDEFSYSKSSKRKKLWRRSDDAK